VPVRKPQNRGDAFGRAGQCHGVGLVRGEPFVAGVFFERGGFKKNFAGQYFFEPAEQFKSFGNHFGRFRFAKTIAMRARWQPVFLHPVFGARINFWTSGKIMSRRAVFKGSVGTGRLLKKRVCARANARQKLNQNGLQRFSPNAIFY
jgi:hypothetical protein